MTRGLLSLLAALALSCRASDGPEAGEARAKPEKSTPATQTALPVLPTPPASKAPHGLHDPAIAPLLSQLKYKPDPYETQPGCIAEPKSQLRDELVLWVELALRRDAQGSVALAQASYSVSTTRLSPRDEMPESAGIPRLELVYRDGLTTHTDFEGTYREPRSSDLRRTSDVVPRDPTWVPGWLANASVSADVVAHRIVLDGKVLKEVKRPDDPPRLGNIECDDTSADGLKLSWHATLKDAQAPLLVEVMRFENQGFVELLPSTEAREVQGFTLLPADRKASADLVLLVSLTDTFRFVTRGVLVPRKAL